MDITSTGKYNGKFLRPNSAKPIVGHATITAFQTNLTQAKAGAELVAGQPVAVSTQASGTQAGSGLNPNVFVANAITDSISGFAIESDNFAVVDGAESSKALKGSIINVALLGSGVEVFLPCKSSEFQNFVVGTPIFWSKTNGELTKTEDTSKNATIALNVAVLSNPVDSIKADLDGTFKSCQAIKVKL